MSDAAPRCAFHPGRETLVSCSRCERPICPDCAVQAAVGQRCIQCVAEERRQAPSVARELTAHRRSLRRPSPLFVAMVAVWFALIGALWAQGNPTALAIPGGVKALGVAMVILGWLISLCLHEWAHAFVAYRSGDHSVVGKGYLTMDPRKYTDPVLSFVLPIAFLVLGGIGLPGGAVWIDRSAIRSRQREALVSAAGPAVNIAFGAACLGATRLIEFHAVWLASALAYLGWLEMLTAALNLLPIPGLDGYGIIDPYLPHDVRASMWEIARYSLFVIFFLVAFTPVGDVLWDVAWRGVDAVGVERNWVALGQDVARPSLK